MTTTLLLWQRLSGCQGGGFRGDGVYNELVVAHVARVGQHGQRRKLDEPEAAVIACRRRALERRQTRLALQTFDEVPTLDRIVRLIHDPQRHRT